MEQRKKKGEDGLISNFVSLNTPGTHISVVKPWLSAFCNLLFKNISKLRRLEAEKLVHAFISYCKDLCWVTHINQYKRLLLIYKTVTIHLMSCIRPLKINEFALIGWFLSAQSALLRWIFLNVFVFFLCILLLLHSFLCWLVISHNSFNCVHMFPHLFPTY